MELKSILEELHFHETEADIYIALADLGSCSAKDIARKTGIGRTTVHAALHKLISKGLVALVPQARGSCYMLNRPGALLQLIQMEKEELLRREELAKVAIGQIQSRVSPIPGNVPRVQVFDGKKAVESMLYNYSPLWHQSIMENEKVVWGYQDSDYFKQYSEYSKHYWNVKTSKYPGYRICLFADAQEKEIAEQLKIPNREIRILPKGVDFTSTIWVGGDYVIFICTRQTPNYATQIHDSVIAANLKQIFQFLWQATNFKRGANS